jgi:hypothetical protein
MPKNSTGERLAVAAVNILLVLVLVSLGIVAWLRLPTFIAWAKSQVASPEPPPALVAQPILAATETDIQTDPQVQPPPVPAPSGELSGISRKLLFDTVIPTRPRVDVITYTVETGDSLFSIAEEYNLKPETILWGNFETLEDNPHLLSTGQVLNILPTDGTYYRWSLGDNLNGVAQFFGVEPKAIEEYPGNSIDLTAVMSGSLAIEPGTWLIVPGGSRPLKDWGPPAISRSNPASARYYGDGYCGSIYEGAVGTGVFVWPTTDHSISGYGYSGIHPAIDIAGSVGNSVFAADSGVVVFAGWSNYGYGYMVVVDHGNGWQTAYAHLSAVGVTCGQSVFQGGYVGALGSTGNSTGPHLHFEMVYNGAKPNPLDYVQ